MEWRNLTSALANGAWLRRRTRVPADKLAAYFQHGFWGRHKVLTGIVLSFVAAIYGLIYGVTLNYFLVQLMIPIAALSILIMAMLPENGRAFERSIYALFCGFLFALAVWPDYVGLDFPGLPWLTVNRIIAFPLCLLFIISLSQSKNFRASLVDVLISSGPAWKFILAFFVISTLSIGVSDKPIESINKLIVAIYGWGAVFLIAVLFFRVPARTERFMKLLWFGAVLTCLVGVLEAKMGAVPWAGRIPSFLQIDDPAIHRVLAGAMRAALGEHRVQAKFMTPLSLAEFLALAFPFIIHLAVSRRHLFERFCASVSMPLVLYVILQTDSRLGVVGVIIATLGYAFFWFFRKWRKDRSSILAPLIVAGYPAMIVVLLVSSFFVGRIRNAVWGSGAAYQSSDDARQEQMVRGIELIIQQPWGYGMGRAAEVLGYTGGGDVLTIDSYYLSIALDAGILGFFAYYGAFLIIIWKATWLSDRASETESSAWLIPGVIALASYVVIKSILSQQETHPLAFAILGLVVAMIHQVKSADQRGFPGMASARKPLAVSH
jgi:hypothetical protein